MKMQKQEVAAHAVVNVANVKHVVNVVANL